MNAVKFCFNINETEYGLGVETSSYNAYIGIKRKQEYQPESSKHIKKRIKPFKRKNLKQ